MHSITTKCPTWKPNQKTTKNSHLEFKDIHIRRKLKMYMSNMNTQKGMRCIKQPHKNNHEKNKTRFEIVGKTIVGRTRLAVLRAVAVESVGFIDKHPIGD
jgi:hypothetical protein